MKTTSNEVADILANEDMALNREEACSMWTPSCVQRLVSQDRVAKERPSCPDPERQVSISWYRELIGLRFPPPIANMDRTTAIDVHHVNRTLDSGAAQQSFFARSAVIRPRTANDVDVDAARCALRARDAEPRGRAG